MLGEQIIPFLRGLIAEGIGSFAGDPRICLTGVELLLKLLFRRSVIGALCDSASEDVDVILELVDEPLLNPGLFAQGQDIDGHTAPFEERNNLSNHLFHGALSGTKNGIILGPISIPHHLSIIPYSMSKSQ